MATKNKNKTAEQEAELPELSVEQENDIETSPSPEKPKVLTALCPVLYLSHQYKTGDTLPVNNPEMVNAWLEAKSAAWKEYDKDAEKQFP